MILVTRLAIAVAGVALVATSVGRVGEALKVKVTPATVTVSFATGVAEKTSAEVAVAIDGGEVVDDVAAELGLWILLEAFDEADIAVMNALVSCRQTQAGLLLGVNSRDLQTLQVVPERLLTMADLLPAHLPRVAESGVGNAADAAAMARAGWTMALVGTALMSATAGAEPLAQAMLAAARESTVTACRSELARDSGERL